MFPNPKLTRRVDSVQAAIEMMVAGITALLANPTAWRSRFDRLALARTVESWAAMDRRQVTIDDATAAIDGSSGSGKERLDFDALRSARDVVGYVSQAAVDPYFEYSAALIKGLHYVMMHDSPEVSPGLFRTDPSVDDVATQLDEVLDSLQRPSDSLPVPVSAGMAHLNLVATRPFKGGNAAMARTLQLLVLARGWSLHPSIAGVDEYLAGNLGDYYQVLEEVGASRRAGRGDAGPWIRFVMKAHLFSAHTWERRIVESERLWDLLEEERSKHGLDPRVTSTLYDAAMGLTVRRHNHVLSCNVSDRVASSDLKGLADLGLLRTVGEKRGRVYVAGAPLRRLRRDSRVKSPPPPDPFE